MYRGEGIEEYCDSSVQSLYCVQTMYLSIFFYTGAYEVFLVLVWFFWFVLFFLHCDHKQRLKPSLTISLLIIVL